ncbi:MAG: hypothetical protein NVS4B5_22250 [Vulcanimicrobiaceae bacterium]
MLETTLVRVGNETYARDNDSYGLTTLRDRHVRVDAGAKRVRLQFRGKSGVDHAVTIDDRRLARAVKRCRDLPGEVLFSYLDDAGESTPVHSEDVNAYLREATGGDFSAKDFRTWAATVTCANELAAQGEAATLADAKRNVVAALEAARTLGLASVAILGCDGGEVVRRNLADVAIVVASSDIPRIQETQATIYHVVREGLGSPP